MCTSVDIAIFGIYTAIKYGFTFTDLWKELLCLGEVHKLFGLLNSVVYMAEDTQLFFQLTTAIHCRFIGGLLVV